MAAVAAAGLLGVVIFRHTGKKIRRQLEQEYGVLQQ